MRSTYRADTRGLITTHSRSAWTVDWLYSSCVYSYRKAMTFSLASHSCVCL